MPAGAQVLSARRAEGRIARKGCTFSRVSAGGRAACAPRHKRGPFSFTKENGPLLIPQEKGIRLEVSDLNDSYASGMGMPARGGAAFSVAIRLASASIIRCRSADLVGVLTNIRLPEHSTMRRAPAMPHSAGSLPPNYRHSRLTVVRRGCEW